MGSQMSFQYSHPGGGVGTYWNWSEGESISENIFWEMWGLSTPKSCNRNEMATDDLEHFQSCIEAMYMPTWV